MDVGLVNELAVGSLVCMGMMFLAKIVGPQDLCGADLTPRWSWQVCLSFQVFFFPLCAYLAWKDDGELSYADWVVVPWPEDRPHSESRAGVRLFMAAFVGYMVKDMNPVLIKIGTMYWAHHIVCLFLTYFFLFGNMPPAPFIIAAASAEFGSSMMNLHAMGVREFAGLRFVTWGLLGMTASNLCTMYMTVPFNVAPALADAPLVRWAINIILTGLCVERERFAVNTYFDDATEMKKAKGNKKK